MRAKPIRPVPPHGKGAFCSVFRVPGDEQQRDADGERYHVRESGVGTGRVVDPAARVGAAEERPAKHFHEDNGERQDSQPLEEAASAGIGLFSGDVGTFRHTPTGDHKRSQRRNGVESRDDGGRLTWE